MLLPIVALLHLPSNESLSRIPSGNDLREARVPLCARAVGVVNTGLDAVLDPVPAALFSTKHLVSGPLVAFHVDEREQGSTDLNGDGDAFDLVAHLYDARDERTRNLGLAAVSQVLLSPREFLLSIDEREAGLDLNGDLDVEDHVLARHQVRPPGTVSLGLAGSFQVLTPGGLAVARVTEAAEGHTDLNGDGDASDRVVQVFGPPVAKPVGKPGAWLPGASLGSRLAIPQQLVGPVQETALGIALFVLEPDEGGLDRNGDGDALDPVLALLDPVTLRVRNLALSTDIDVPSENRWLAMRVMEAQQGASDRNGDGDALDHVVHLLDGATGQVSNLGIAAAATQVLGDWLAIAASEGDQGGLDRNGDGDALDQVLVVRHASEPVETNLGLAVFGVTGGTQQRFLFCVNEHSQGGTDLNGDGDIFDNVLFSYDPLTGGSANLGTALYSPPVKAERLVPLIVNETYAGADFNFDGDVDDMVLGIYDGELDTFWNTRLAVGDTSSLIPEPPRVQLAGDRLAAGVLEGSAAQDLNGDGDLGDTVVFSYDAQSGLLTNTGLAGVLHLGSELLAVDVIESQQASTDLNGDGDTFDEVVHVLRLAETLAERPDASGRVLVQAARVAR